MKLLLDQNVSPQLVARLADLFPDSAHVYMLGLDRASDADVWLYARDHGYIVLSKDADYSDLSLLLGLSTKAVVAANRQLHHRADRNSVARTVRCYQAHG